MREVRLYFWFMRMHILSGLEYRGWWMMVLLVMLTCILDPLGTVLMFLRFGAIESWTVERILLIYAIAVTSYGLAESFVRGFDYFPVQLLRTGDFDRLLLRPKSLFTQTAASVFHIHRLSRPFAGITVIIWCLWRQGIVPTYYNVLILILALLGGLAMYSGVFVMISGVSFFTIGAIDWAVVFTNASYQVARIPHDHMPRLLRNLFTFLMPMLVVSYYPASAICGWSVGVWQAWLAFPAGLAFLIMSLFVWSYGVKHYKSTGS